MPATRLVKVLQRLRDLHADMTVLQVQFLLWIAANPGENQRALLTALDVSDSVASRNLAILSEYGVRGTEGLALVEMRMNPTDRRAKLLYLTRKGRSLLEDIVSDLGRK
jgi:DNA-binding MarR family transcriptional regulator